MKQQSMKPTVEKPTVEKRQMKSGDTQDWIRDRLKQRLVEAKKKNARVSVRSFAQSLNIPASTLSLVLLGKRKLSPLHEERLVHVLKLDPVEQVRLKETLAINRVGPTTPPHVRNKEIETAFKPDQYRMNDTELNCMNAWYTYAILSLVAVKGFQPEPAWIAARLGIEESQAQDALNTLLDVGLLVKEINGRVVRSFAKTRTADGNPNRILRASHYASLDLAKNNLDQISKQPDLFSKSDYTWMNVPIARSALPEIRTRIREFQDAILNTYAVKAEADEVVRFSTQLYPLTKNEEGQQS
jgi:uncharacterized protein (TIGR02147 family)